MSDDPQSRENPQGDPDIELVHRAREGDTTAFEMLVRRHERRVYRTTLAVTGNDADAEEALQETFLKSYLHLSEFRADSRFTTWLTRIAVNEGLLILRRRRPTASLDDPGFADEEIRPKQVEEWRPNPEQLYAAQQLKEIVEAGIRSLPRQFRVALVLHDIEELSNEEAAEVLGLGVPAFKSRVHRGRLLLREALATRLQKPPTLASRARRASAMMRNMVAMVLEKSPERKKERVP